MPLNSRAVRNLGQTALMEMIMKYPNITLGQIEAIANKVGGTPGIERLLRNELILVDPTPAKKGDQVTSPLFTFAGSLSAPPWKMFDVRRYMEAMKEGSGWTPQYRPMEQPEGVLERNFRDQMKELIAAHTRSTDAELVPIESDDARLVGEKLEFETPSGTIIVKRLSRDQHSLPLNDRQPGVIAGLGGLQMCLITAAEYFAGLRYWPTVANLQESNVVVGYISLPERGMSCVSASLRTGVWHTLVRDIMCEVELREGCFFLKRERPLK